MSIPSVTIRQLVEAGVHFGHTTHRWNPKMGTYIFGARNGVHIINLDKTAPMLRRALQTLHDVVASGGHALLVGTKKQARQAIADSATQSQQYYINHRWLGGTLTNWNTISRSITHLKELGALLDGSESLGLTKRERLGKERAFNKLNQVLVGIKDMPGRPDIIFVIDTNIDHIAIKEAKKLGIPVIAVVDTNSSLEGIDYPIPGNDDAGKAINLYCDLLTGTILEGLSRYISNRGQDVGSQNTPFEAEASAKVTEEVTPEEATPEKATPEQVTPEEATPEQVTPEQVTPEQVTPEKATPEQVTPEKATPEQATPIQATPEQATPIQATPIQATPEQVTPIQATPEQVTPEEATPIQAESVESRPDAPKVEESENQKEATP